MVESNDDDSVVVRSIDDNGSKKPFNNDPVDVNALVAWVEALLREELV